MVYNCPIFYINIKLTLQAVIFLVQKVNLRLQFAQYLFVLVLLVLKC